MYVDICMYVYIYICIERERETIDVATCAGVAIAHMYTFQIGRRMDGRTDGWMDPQLVFIHIHQLFRIQYTLF